ncbi:MAG: hypothetical protein AMXMBFR47_08330 [Planctomycetota bacterium]
MADDTVSVFPMVPLGRIATVKSGFAFKSKDWQESGVPVVKIANVKAGRLAMDGCSFVDETVAASASMFELAPGDILIAMTGYIGEVAKVRDEGRCLLNQRVGRFSITDEDQLDRDYLFLWLTDSDTKATMEHLGYGSAQPNVSPTLIESVEIPLPPLTEQRAIAGVLGALDDKIEVNRKTARVLEGIARAVFTSWFVDFDPVRRHAAPRTPAAAALPPDLAALFPKRLVDSPIGEVPEGWRVGTLGDLIDTVKGRSYKSEELVPSETALVTLKSFARGGGYRPDGLKAYAGTYKPEQVVKPGELVVSCTDVTQAAEVIGRPAIVRAAREFKTLVASLDTLIIRPRDGAVTRAFLYFLGGTEAFVAHTYAHTTGTTVLHLAKQAVPSFRFPLPPKPLVRQFDGLASPVLERLQGLADESEVLAALRDALLPKLISGEFRIADAEKFVGRAT